MRMRIATATIATAAKTAGRPGDDGKDDDGATPMRMMRQDVCKKGDRTVHQRGRTGISFGLHRVAICLVVGHGG